MAMNILEELSIHIIISKLSPEEVASVSCMSRRFRSLVYDDDLLWSKFCADDLGLHSPIDHLGNTLPNFQVAYMKWREAFSMYPWSLVTRVKKFWDGLKNWLAANLPEALPTLRMGVSEDEIASLESCLSVKLPLPTRVLYRFCDGQELPDHDFSPSMPSSLLGLIGGYSFYDHLTNVSLLPLHQVVSETRRKIQQIGFGSKSKYIVVASSFTINEKFFFLNCTNGQLYVGTRNLTADGEMLPCVPDSLISSVHDCKGSQPQDALLLWLEEHGRRLADGIIRVRRYGNDRSISLFPELPPTCSTSVTNGVKVRASSVFVPEFSNLQDADKFLFAYSIRMSLSPGGCFIDGINVNSCQLYSRHWVIRLHDTVLDVVDGVAVIGKHPVLRSGQEEFVYESCSFLASVPGSIEGFFTFVPGRLADPKGSMFQVDVARFPLQLPDYIF